MPMPPTHTNRMVDITTVISKATTMTTTMTSIMTKVHLLLASKTNMVKAGMRA